MKTSEAIQRVQSLYSGGVQSDNSRLTLRHIYSALLTGRSILLRQQANKRQKISQWVYQVIPCVELITAPIHECPCVPAGGCTILRSKYRLPKPVTGLENSLIQSITSLDGQVKFDETTFEAMKFDSGNKYTAVKPRYFIRDGYLYVTVLKLLKAITLTGLFDDFIEANQFPSVCGECTECECLDILDTEFPIDGDLMRPLLQIANEELIVMFKQMGNDKSNDSRDDSETKGSMIHQPEQQG